MLSCVSQRPGPTVQMGEREKKVLENTRIVLSSLFMISVAFPSPSCPAPHSFLQSDVRTESFIIRRARGRMRLFTQASRTFVRLGGWEGWDDLMS